MSNLIWHVTMSLDGFIAGRDDSMDWVVAQWSNGGENTREIEVQRSAVADEVLQRAGAEVSVPTQAAPWRQPPTWTARPISYSPWLRGELPVAEAEACGVRVAGDVKAFARLVPAPTSPAAGIPATTHEGDNP